MAWPDLTSLPSDPNNLSPESLREWYENMRTVFLDLVAELGNNPGGASTVETRLTNLEAADAGISFTTKTGNYTFALVDANTIVESNSASALTFTVPQNSSVPFPIGTLIGVGRYGAGTLAVAAGTNVTIVSPNNMLSLRARYSEASLRKRATNEWWLSGDLV